MGSSLEYYRRPSAIGKQVDLNGQVLMNIWATPSVRDEKDSGLLKERSPRKDGRPRIDSVPIQVFDQQGYKGKLNPRWVETLMGLPVGWTMPSCANPWTIVQTSYECWETESYQAQQNERSESSGMLWSTPPASQRGDTYIVYLRRSINRLKQGGQPFAPPLQVSVALAELGLSTSTVDIFSGLDLTEDTEVLIKEIIESPHV